MKKILIATIALFLSATAVMAQKIGIAGGANFSKPHITNLGAGAEQKMRTGFYVGGIVDFEINEYISVQPGLHFSLKPIRTESDFGPLGNGITTANPFYIELPVNVVGKYKLGNGKIFVSAGPYVAYGVAGKVKIETNYLGVSSDDTRNIKWGNDEQEDNIKPLDFGVNGGLGYQLKNGLFFNLGYQRGFINLIPGNPDTNEANTSMFRAGLGFMF